MSNYTHHALCEFRAMGWIDAEGKYIDEMQELLCTQVLELLELFGKHGHSGSSAVQAINLFSRLASFGPLNPLTGEDWEWNEICDERTGGASIFQNKRCGRVFKQSDRFDGKPYDMEAVVFYELVTDEATGFEFKSYFLNSNSARVIEFPYVPTTVYEEAKSE